MANAFEEVRQRLDKKERELMMGCDQYMDTQTNEIDSFIRLVHGRCQNLLSQVEMIKHSIKSNDEVGLMYYFSQNHQKIMQIALGESEITQVKEIPKQVNLKCDVDI